MANGRTTRRSKRSGFGNYRKLPSGRYQARYTGPDGKVYNGPRTFPNETEAQGWLAAERRMIDLDTWRPLDQRKHRNETTTLTVTDFAQRWLDSAGHLTPGSRSTYQSLIDKRIRPYLDDTRVSEFDRVSARDWVNTMRADFPETTARNAQAYTLLHNVFNAAVDDDLIVANPVSVKGAGKKPRPDHEDVLAPAQVDAIADQAPEVYRAAILTAAWCGLRFGEFSELRRKDVTLLGNHVKLKVQRGASRVDGETYVGTPKAGSERRPTVPPHLVPILKKHMATHVGAEDDALLFPNSDGNRIQPSTFRNHFYRWAEKAGVPGTSPHALRHFGGTMYALSGATTREIMDYLGHKSLSSAMHYQHVAQGRADQLAQKLSAIASAEEVSA